MYTKKNSRKFQFTLNQYTVQVSRDLELFINFNEFVIPSNATKDDLKKRLEDAIALLDELQEGGINNTILVDPQYNVSLSGSEIIENRRNIARIATSVESTNNLLKQREAELALLEAYISDLNSSI